MEQQSCPAGHSGCKHEKAAGVCDYCGFDFEAEHLTAESLEVAKREAREQARSRTAQDEREQETVGLRAPLEEKLMQVERCEAELGQLRSSRDTMEAALSEAQNKLDIALTLEQEKNQEITRQKKLLRKEADAKRSLEENYGRAEKEVVTLREEIEVMRKTASQEKNSKTIYILAAILGVVGVFISYQLGEKEGQRQAAAAPRPAPAPVSPPPAPAAAVAVVSAPSLSVKPVKYLDLQAFRDPLKAGGEGPELVVLPGGQMAMGRTEVTVGQYLACVKAGGCKEPEWREAGSQYHYQTGSNDLYKQLGAALTGDNYPIVGVSWKDAEAYVKWLTKQTGKAYRLPKEDEWERACRAGEKHEYCGSNDIDAVKWTSNKDNALWTHPVGSRPNANAWGLVDMSGNVWEWTDSCWESDCGRRVLRGGSWDITSYNARRAAILNGSVTSNRLNIIGFRLARTLP